MRLDSYSQQRKKGAILILLLGLLFACALMVAAFVQSALNELRFASQSIAEDRLRPHAYSALNCTLASINEYKALNEPIYHVSEAIRKASDASFLELPPSIRIELDVADCAAKVGIANMSSRDQWQTLFEPLQLSNFEASNLIDAVLDWMDADDSQHPYGAENDTYQALDKAHFPPNQPIRSMHEFRSIRGFLEQHNLSPTTGPKLFTYLFDTLSTQHRGPPNLNTANEAVLNYITQNEVDTRAIIDYRNGPDGQMHTADDRVFKTVDAVERFGIQTKQPYALIAGPFIVRIRVFQAGRKFALSAYLTNNSGAQNQMMQVAHCSEYLQF